MRKRKPTCMIETCTKKHYARGVCRMHYEIIRKNNDWKAFIEVGYALPFMHNKSPKKIVVVSADQREILIFMAWLNKRIDDADRYNLPEQYRFALKDMAKVLYRHEPLLRLII